MLKKIAKRILRPGAQIPAFYGVAWEDIARHEVVCLPIGLNCIARMARALYIQIKRGFSSCPMDPRDAYSQGYRAGAKSKVDHKKAFMELIAYWRYRAKGLRVPPKEKDDLHPLARTLAIELDDCANNLEKAMQGESTEATGWQIK